MIKTVDCKMTHAHELKVWVSEREREDATWLGDIHNASVQSLGMENFNRIS